MHTSTVVVGGKNDIAVEGLRYLLERFPDKKVLVTVNRTETGRDGFQRSFLKFANERGLRVIALEEAYDLVDAMFLSLEYDRLIDPKKFRMKRLINIHFSALPAYKGMFTSAWPLRMGERESGVTLHDIDRGIDTGPIIAQRRFAIGSDDTCKDLYAKYIANGILLVRENLARMLSGDYVATPQPIEGSTYFPRSSLDFSKPQIELFQTAENIRNQLRSFSFRDYQVPVLNGTRVFGCSILPERDYGRPGRLLEEGEDDFLFSTVDYNILIYKDRLTELLQACRAGDTALVQRYLRNRQLLNEQHEGGVTPLIAAASAGQGAIVKLLLQLGARTDVSCYQRKLPKDYASGSEVRSLLEAQ